MYFQERNILHVYTEAIIFNVFLVLLTFITNCQKQRRGGDRRGYVKKYIEKVAELFKLRVLLFCSTCWISF